MSVKAHYDLHLSHFYSWMIGNLEENISRFKDILIKYQIKPYRSEWAIDLGAGNGIQTKALLELGFKVCAIDFNQKLLNELKTNTLGYHPVIINDDIKNFTSHLSFKPELIICCGDTITHLDTKQEVFKLMENISTILLPGGKLLLSYRDYRRVLSEDERFINVKSDENRILTCFLEFHDEFINVTDLIYELSEGVWEKKISSYKKVRIMPDEVNNCLLKAGFAININEKMNGMIYVIATKTDKNF